MKGRRPPGFGQTLGSLVRSAIDQIGTVREAVDRGTSLQKSWFDATLLQRKRKDALAALGEAVFGAAVRGELDRLEHDSRVRSLVDTIDELDQRIEVAEQRAHGAASADQAPRPEAGRGRASRQTERGEGPRVWRPVAAWTAPDPPRVDDEAYAADDEQAEPRAAAAGPAAARRRRSGRTGEVAVVADPLDPASYPDDYDPLDDDRESGDAAAAVVRAAPRRPLGPSPDALGDDFGHRIDGDDAVSAFPARAARHLSRAYDERDDDLEDYMEDGDVPAPGERHDVPAPGELHAVPDRSDHKDSSAPRRARRSRAAAARKAKGTSGDD